MDDRDFTDSLFGPDGTQAPPPPPVAADPLAGLVTGTMVTTAAGISAEDSAVGALQVAEPARPDERAIRQAVDAAMAQERVASASRQAANRAYRAGRVPAARSTGQPAALAPQGAPAGWQVSGQRQPRNPPRPGLPGGGTRIGGPAVPARGGPGNRRPRSAARTTGRLISWLVFLAILGVIVYGALHGSSGSFGG